MRTYKVVGYFLYDTITERLVYSEIFSYSLAKSMLEAMSIDDQEGIVILPAYVGKRELYKVCDYSYYDEYEAEERLVKKQGKYRKGTVPFSKMKLISPEQGKKSSHRHANRWKGEDVVKVTGPKEYKNKGRRK
jgi:hypothetical protein